MKLNSYFIPLTKINSKTIIDPNSRAKAKLLEENMELKLYDTGLGHGFLDITPEAK